MTGFKGSGLRRGRPRPRFTENITKRYTFSHFLTAYILGRLWERSESL